MIYESARLRASFHVFGASRLAISCGFAISQLPFSVYLWTRIEAYTHLNRPNYLVLFFGLPPEQNENKASRIAGYHAIHILKDAFMRFLQLLKITEMPGRL